MEIICATINSIHLDKSWSQNNLNKLEVSVILSPFFTFDTWDTNVYVYVQLLWRCDRLALTLILDLILAVSSCWFSPGILYLTCTIASARPRHIWCMLSFNYPNKSDIFISIALFAHWWFDSNIICFYELSPLHWAKWFPV